MVSKIKWKSIVALILVFCGIIFNIPLVFGFLYILWAILDLKSGYAYIVEDVTREKNPILFWLIVLVWLFSGVYIFLKDIFLMIGW